MKRKMLMAANKKGLNYYSPIIAIMGIFILGAILSNLFVKQYKLSSDFDLGREQFRILLTASSAEKALLFVDDAARLALEQAAYVLGGNGFHDPGLPYPCGAQKDKSGKIHALWTKDIILPEKSCVPEPVPMCYPEEGEMKKSLLKLFEGSFRRFIDSFNSKSDVKIQFDYKLFDYGSFDLPPVIGMTQVVGISNKPIAIGIPGVNYEVKPGFREGIPFDVIGNGKEAISSAKQMAGLSEKDTRKKVSEFNSAGKLKWALDGYWNAKSTCTYDMKETCSYVCGSHVECTNWNKDGCTMVGEIVSEDKCRCLNSISVEEYCSGTYQKTISYDEPSSLLSASEAGKLLSYSAAAGKPELKSPEYNFGLSWITVTGCTQTCSGRDPKPC